jgi:CRISPR/Cas system-associated protein Csx1
MNKLINKINKDRRLSLGLALLALILDYIIFSLALNSGSLIQYFLAILKR